MHPFIKNASTNTSYFHLSLLLTVSIVPTENEVGGGGAYLNSKLPLGEVDALLALLLCDKGGLVLGEASADSAGLLGSEVEGEVLLALVEEAELGALVGLDDGQDTGNGLAEVVAVRIQVSDFFFPSFVLEHCV